MLQLVYISSAKGAPDLGTILAKSRRNNGRDSITGLLYSDDVRFMQVLEGPEDKVEAAFARIQQDSRHRGLVVLSPRLVDAREFGSWEMAHRAPSADGARFLEAIAPKLVNTTPSVRATFEGFMKVKRAA